MKKIAVLLLLVFPILSFSQKTEDDTEKEKETIFKQFLNNLTGSFESNAQWYVNDNVLGEFRDPISEFP